MVRFQSMRLGIYARFYKIHNSLLCSLSKKGKKENSKMQTDLRIDECIGHIRPLVCPIYSLDIDVNIHYIVIQREKNKVPFGHRHHACYTMELTKTTAPS